ncbi:hypothetical protein [Ferrovibrio sp.]|uniref:hypothetical protein n=1 Tax=Ferrovibrio sp. TaxID=1917215 RepID=UPI0025C425BF|nr:hypothetical protein [Ferrovibrio sp.]MBX3454298.1 hypothetical protein [Ferrovibrio sp.]
MLLEWLQLVGMRCDAPARKLGYARAQVGLWSRAKRCHAAWAQHHANTRSFIEALLKDLPAGGNCWVLGAGLLEDLPLAALAAKFDHVLLADICFMRQVWHAAQAVPRCEPRLFDATGVTAGLTGWHPGQPLPEPAADLPLDDTAPSLVLSVNLLSQLPLLPLEWLERQGVGLSERQAYGRRILQAHLSALRALPCRVGLISDHRRIFRNRAGEAVVSESAVLDITLPPAETEWTWALAPLGEIDRQTSLDLRVLATRDLSLSAG